MLPRPPVPWHGGRGVSISLLSVPRTVLRFPLWLIPSTLAALPPLTGDKPSPPTGVSAATTLVNADGSSIDLTLGTVWSYVMSSQLGYNFVHRSTLAYLTTSNKNRLIINGGFYFDSTGTATPMSKTVVVDFTSVSPPALQCVTMRYNAQCF